MRSLGAQFVAIAVGPPVTQRPPPRSRCAVFPHRALQEDSLPPSDLSIEATGSHVPHTSLEHGHALFMPDATQPVSRLPIVAGRRTVTEITRPRYHAATASIMLRCRMFSSKTIIAAVLRRLWKSQAPL